MTIIDGKSLKEKKLAQLKLELEKLDRKLGLAVIQVGEDFASGVYIKQKEKMALELGYNFKHIKMDSNCLEKEVLDLIDKLNKDIFVDGILVQLPLPKHFNSDIILNRISPYKDVDGLSDYNKKMLDAGDAGLYPCTPLAIVSILNHYKIKVKDRKVVVVGRGELVGKPVTKLLVRMGAEVDVCHSKTENLISHTKNADILIVAVGKSSLIKENMVKDGAVVIDVGINRVDGKVCGDVDFSNVIKKCSHITPVPGGVGPMTIAELAQNVYRAHLLANDIKKDYNK